MCSIAADVENMSKAVLSARSLAAEELDKESRRCNIIIHRVPECPADNGMVWYSVLEFNVPLDTV